MATKEIMLVCAAGMSTSLMVTRMQKAAEEKGMQANIFAVPVPEAESYLAEHQVDVVLLGPQVRYLLDGFREKLATTPVDVIPMTDYGMMKAAEKLSQAQAALLEAHHAQTDMLTREAQGEKNEINLFMVHGQDHLMTSIAFVDLAKEIIALYQKIEK